MTIGSIFLILIKKEAINILNNSKLDDKGVL